MEKTGRRSYIFWNYDEWGNLMGIDYYSPYNPTNPYLEMANIPSAVYFAIAWGTKWTGSTMSVKKFFRVIYILSLYPHTAYYLQTYIGASIDFDSQELKNRNNRMPENVKMAGRTINSHTYQFDYSGLSLEWILSIVLHESLHGSEEMGIDKNFLGKLTEHFSYYKFAGRSVYISDYQKYTVELINYMGPLYKLGIWRTNNLNGSWRH